MSKDLSIVLLGHRMGVGKDTLADIMAERLGFYPVAYANVLKATASVIFGLSKDDIFTQEGKRRVHPRFGITNREILQRFGTEVARSIHSDVWVHALADSMEELRQNEGINNFVVTDFRFPNEYSVLRNRFPEANIKAIRIDRPAVVSGASHSSEEALADWKGWDFSILNNGTVWDLYTDFLINYTVCRLKDRWGDGNHTSNERSS